MANNNSRLVIGTRENPVRFSYLHVLEPYAFNPGEKGKYSVQILIPKDDAKLVAQVNNAIKAAYDTAVTEKWGGNKPPMAKASCLFDGDEPKDNGESRGESHEGMYYLNAKSDNAPGVLDSKGMAILSSEEFKSGDYGCVSVAFSGWSNSGKYGISCYLNNILKVRDGQALGSGRTSASDDFAGMFDTDESDDM